MYTAPRLTPLILLDWERQDLLLMETGSQDRVEGERGRRIAEKQEGGRGLGRAALWLLLSLLHGHPGCTLWNCGNLWKQNQAEPKISSTNKNYITWMFSKADFALVFCLCSLSQKNKQWYGILIWIGSNPEGWSGSQMARPPWPH